MKYIIKILKKFLDIKRSLLQLINEKQYRALVTLVGKGHHFGTTGRIYLTYGSTKDDIILNDHSEVFGHIFSSNHGKVEIGEWTTIPRGTMVNAANSVKIGADVSIAPGVIIIDNNTHPINPQDRRIMQRTSHGSKERNSMFSDNAPIVIMDNVWLGRNVRVHKGVTIGENSIIGANAIVTKNIPSNCIAVGIPAKVVKTDIDKNTASIFKCNS